MKPRHKRMVWVLAGVAALGVAAALVLNAFQSNLVFFFTPTQIANGEVPKGNETIQVLSRMYTETLGAFGLYLFYVGAVAVLYSTVFAATAANSRILADMVRLTGRFDAGDYAARLRYQNLFIAVLALTPCLMYFGLGEPVQMVKIGGLVLAVMLPVLAVAIVYLRHTRLPEEVAPGKWATATLWLVAGLILVTMMGYALVQVGLIRA